MVKSCAIYGCLSSTRHDKDRHFYGFPSDENRRRQWVQASDRPELANKSAKTLQTSYYVCDLHFQNSDILAKKLRAFAIPTLNLALRDNSNPSKLTQTEYVITLQKEAATQTAVPITSHATQTTKALSACTCKRKMHTEFIPECKRQMQTEFVPECKRKMQIEFVPECKRLKILETETKYEDQKEQLSPQFGNLIDLQNRLQQNSRGNRYQKEYKLLALNIYFASPLAYRVLAKTLSLPSERTLRRMSINIGTKLYPDVYECLKSKLKTFKDSEKYCIICADEISLKPNLHYQINEDKIIGFHEIDGVQTTEPASEGFVIMARGIFSKWTQQLGYSLLAENKNYEELNEWLDCVISNIINMGFKVVAFVSNQGSNFINLATQGGVSCDQPYFCINGRKIYYIFDVPYLIKSLRNDFIKHDFEFVDSDGSMLTAKWEDVQKFYVQDSTRCYRLAPKLTESHINPNNVEKMKVKTATQVFSHTVAAAMNISIECGLLEESATGTVKLIELMDKAFDVLNSSVLNNSNKYKNAFAFEPYQTEVLDQLDSFISTVSVLNKAKKNVINSVKCLKGLKISVQSIKSLAQDLQADGFHILYTRRLNKDPLENFFGSVRQDGGNCRKPTPVQFTKAFGKLFMVDMLKHSEDANCADNLDHLLTKAGDINKFKSDEENYLEAGDYTTELLPVAIGTVDYRFDLPQENAFVYLCGFLLKKCADIHKCEEMDIFLQEREEAKENVFISHEEHNENKTLLINPPASFVICVKEMDDRFKHFFQQNKASNSDRVGGQILKDLNDISFTDCCECFPNDYLKKLFVRFRIYNIIQFNNRFFKGKCFKQKYFSVCNI